MEQTQNRTNEIVRVSIRGISVNLLLVVCKLTVGLIAGSITVVLDAVNNLSDVLSAAITIVGAKLASKAADKTHPYGHGRIEYIASSLIAVLVLLAGVASLRESVLRILHPEVPDYTVLFALILAAGVIVKLFLGRYYRKMGKALSSCSLSASGTDALFDAGIGFATLISALVNMVLHRNPEGVIGTVIAVFILRSGTEIMNDTVNQIIGMRVDGELAKQVKARICAHPAVHGAYDLMLHSYGPEVHYGAVHIEVDDSMTVRELDALTRQLVPAVYQELGVLLTIGVYATNTHDPNAQCIKEAVQDAVSEYPQILQMHGFYLDDAAQSVSFDVIFDYQTEQCTQITEALRSRLTAQFPEYRFSVNIDRDVSE